MDPTMLFYSVSVVAIFASQVLEYTRLDLTSCKRLFAGIPIYTKDLVQARVTAVVEEPANSKLYLFPYFWTLASTSIVGTLFFFKSPGWFNLLTGILMVYFYVQHSSLNLKIASRLEEKEFEPTCKNVYRELEAEMWVPVRKKISPDLFSEQVFHSFGLSYSGPYGNIALAKEHRTGDDPILDEVLVKDPESFYFYGSDGTLYEIYETSDRKIKASSITTGFSLLFRSLNREQDMAKNLLIGTLESVTTSFVLWLSIIGFSLEV